MEGRRCSIIQGDQECVGGGFQAFGARDRVIVGDEGEDGEQSAAEGGEEVECAYEYFYLCVRPPLLKPYFPTIGGLFK